MIQGGRRHILIKQSGKNNMGRNHFFCLAISVMSIGCTMSKKNSTLNNKILIYAEHGTNISKYYVDDKFYVAKVNDTVYWINHPWSYFDKSSTPTIDSFYKLPDGDTAIRVQYLSVPHVSYVPFQLKRENNNIVIEYFKNATLQKNVQYKLNEKDSAFNIDISSLGFKKPDYGVSRYTGRDTTIRILCLTLKCWIFEETFKDAAPIPYKKNFVFIDKKSLLPVIIKSELFENGNFLIPKSSPQFSTLNFIVENKNELSRKWVVSQ